MQGPGPLDSIEMPPPSKFGHPIPSRICDGIAIESTPEHRDCPTMIGCQDLHGTGRIHPVLRCHRTFQAPKVEPILSPNSTHCHKPAHRLHTRRIQENFWCSHCAGVVGPHRRRGVGLWTGRSDQTAVDGIWDSRGASAKVGPISTPSVSFLINESVRRRMANQIVLYAEQGAHNSRKTPEIDFESCKLLAACARHSPTAHI